jgi:glutamate N-acetyltransferase/amino-acid N-acetyltransferase
MTFPSLIYRVCIHFLFHNKLNGSLKMAVGDVTMPLMHVVQGVKIGSTEAYVRYPNRRDLVIFEFAEGSNVAGV